MLESIRRWNRGAVLAALSCLLAAGSSGQPSATPRYQSGTPSQDGIGKFYYRREIAQVMGFEGAAWLDRAERAREERPDLLLKELHLEPGMTVADIGAGSGYLSKRMAPMVAPGRVLAVDVQPEMVNLLKRLATEPGLSNIVPILGAPDDSRLPAGTIDLAVMVDVYHELSFPFEVVRSIIAALKPGGRLVFVEYRGEDARVPIKPLHKMTVAQIRLEMQPFPITLERTAEELPIQHIVVFRKR